jgi:hypothetical protein
MIRSVSAYRPSTSTPMLSAPVAKVAESEVWKSAQVIFGPVLLFTF